MKRTRSVQKAISCILTIDHEAKAVLDKRIVDYFNQSGPSEERSLKSATTRLQEMHTTYKFSNCPNADAELIRNRPVVDTLRNVQEKG